MRTEATVADNLIVRLTGAVLAPTYDAYGSRPLTVENGRIILEEFGYGGKVMLTFPWDSTNPRRSTWFLNKSVLPWVNWKAMLKGCERLTKSTAG